MYFMKSISYNEVLWAKACMYMYLHVRLLYFILGILGVKNFLSKIDYNKG